MAIHICVLTTSDITYLGADEGWLYLAIVLDPLNREGEMLVA